ncbi:MAG: hypothetical protein AAF721_27250 [Myxococcota bacterium]
MKALEVFADPDAIDAFVRAQWQTEAFARSHDAADGWIRGIVADFCRLPRLFCRLTDPPVERSHFYAWMGVIPLRNEYANPAIADLYLLHEYLHAGQLQYDGAVEPTRWAERIWDNERDASLGSEVFVYFELPELREATFSFEIWADRFLADPEMRGLHRGDHDAFVDFFVTERERAMRSPKPGDRNEALIASYANANLAWADVWRDSYVDVETTMAAFVERCEASRTDAAEYLRAWLKARQGDGLCPFEREARAFAEALSRVMAK